MKHEPVEDPGPSNHDHTPDLPALPPALEEGKDVNLLADATEKPSSPKKIKVETESSPNIDDWLNDVVYVGATESADETIKQEVSIYLGSAISEEEKSLSILKCWKTRGP